MHKRKLPLLILGLAATLVAGCGSDGNGDSGSTSPSSPTAETLSVSMKEFKFSPASLEAPAGKVKINATNDGKTEHELVLLKTDADAASLPTKGGRVDESASVGEIPEVPAGSSKSASFDLKPGRYVMVCNLPGHYQGGMHGTLTVR